MKTNPEIGYESMIINHMNGNLFAMHFAYTDINPYKVLRIISENTLEIQEMKHEADPNDRPEFVPGGFSAICVKSGSRLITEDPNGRILRIRRTKRDPDRWTYKGMRFRLGYKPSAYYDYNF